MRKILLAIALLLTAVLSGCTSDDSDSTGLGLGTGGKPGELPLLADFAACDFRYPDNSTLECENQFTEVPIVSTDPPSPADGWICIYDGAVNFGTHYIFWHPEEDKVGFYYYAIDTDRPVSGWVIVGEEHNYAFYGGESTGFVVLGDHPGEFTTTPWPRNTWFNFQVYDHAFETDTPELQNGTIQTLWSMYNEIPYPLQVLTTSEETYYFHNTTVDERTDWADYLIENFEMEGEDFDLAVHSARHYGTQHTANILPVPSCL